MCSELLEESLEALQILPDASMFDTESISPVWMEVVEKTSKFLRSVVLGEVCPRYDCKKSLTHIFLAFCIFSFIIHSPESSLSLIPCTDRHTSLKLLLEFAIQKGTLYSMLDMVILLMCIWRGGSSPVNQGSVGQGATSGASLDRDNRGSSSGQGGVCAPLIPFLRRVEAIQVYGKEPKLEGGKTF